LYNSIYINLIALASVYWSLDLLFEGDWLVIPFYVLGSVLGKWIAMRHVENIRYKIFKLFGKKINKIQNKLSNQDEDN
jgi:hypothetical protein